MKPMKLYDLDSVFDFGRKHKGRLIKDILYQDPIHLHWCLEQVEWFVLADRVELLCTEEMKKFLRNGRQNNSTNIAEHEELIEEALINDFESNCKKKKSLYLVREKRNDKLNANASEYNYYDDIDDEYVNSSRFNFVRDVLGGDSSAIWNID